MSLPKKLFHFPFRRLSKYQTLEELNYFYQYIKAIFIFMSYFVSIPKILMWLTQCNSGSLTSLWVLLKTDKLKLFDIISFLHIKYEKIFWK